MTSEAIVIGINKYVHLQHLDYAQNDARAVKAFLETEALFDHVYYFAEDAEPVNGISMQPTQNNLRRIMETRLAKRGLGDGDNFWFFFSGHGMRDGERDFLMPIDGYAENVAASGISTADVSKWLRECGADNVVMMLDACRNGGRKDGKGIGDQTEKNCKQTGVISLFSCSPNQFSYELPRYEQGAFTKVLLEGLGVQGACATVARLDEYLKRRVPELVRDCLGDGVNQYPYSIAEPINKAHLILMPQHSRPEDLDALKMDAFRAEKAGDLRLALQCWLRVNIASQGLDNEALDEIFELRLKLRQSAIAPVIQTPTSIPEVPLPKGDSSSSKPVQPPIISPVSQSPSKLRGLASLASSVLKAQSSQPAKPQPTVKPSQPPAHLLDAISIDSVKGVDYRKLRDLLKAGQWRKADEETSTIILKIAKRKTKGYLDADSLQNFPWMELPNIDRLWLVASYGHFGFSVQAKIWDNCGRSMRSGKNWDAFCMKVGWYSANQYVRYSNLCFNPSRSAAGELPSYRVSGGFIRKEVYESGLHSDDVFGCGRHSSGAHHPLERELRES
jgi:uncharacterized caspase-like protein